MNSQEIIEHVFKVIKDNLLTLGEDEAIAAAKATITRLSQEDAQYFYECATCGCLITNDMHHEHRLGWYGS